MVFGRCFENALGAYFRQEDSAAALFKEWGAFRDSSFEYKKGDSWDRVVHQGVHLLETFARDDRVRIHSPQKKPNHIVAVHVIWDSNPSLPANKFSPMVSWVSPKTLVDRPMESLLARR
jgi:hypothetical protein